MAIIEVKGNAVLVSIRKERWLHTDTVIFDCLDSNVAWSKAYDLAAILDAVMVSENKWETKHGS